MGHAETRCFHCGESIPPGADFTLELDGEAYPMCCAGCRAVADLIFHSGLDRYYRFRQGESRRAGDDLQRERSAWAACDQNESLWGEARTDGNREVLLQTEGIHCAACAWLIRNRLGGAPGVHEVHVDIASGYTSIVWDPQETRLSELAMGLYGLGYKPHLPLAGAEELARQQERKQSLRRLGIAGLGMMQVMMYAVALYAGDAQGIGPATERFLEWVSLLVTTPVLLYSGRIFFEGAWRSLRGGRPGMDVPVALAIGIAYTASCVNFFDGSGEVWFDSVVMFIFFLLVGRHVEMSLRHRNLQSGAVLARLLPEWAERVGPEGTETVLAGDLRAQDRARVRVGEAFPADGTILEGETEVNEALLTGESFPRVKRPGSSVVAGSINLVQPVVIQVSTAGRDSTVSALGRLLDRARGCRDSTSLLAEKYATWFIVAVLAIAAVAGAWWYLHDASRMLGVVLAVLVVSCPCALSLAAPSTIAAASRALLKRGVILTRGGALEVLAGIRQVLFDKTGTLTSGHPRIASLRLNEARHGLSRERILDIAAALETASAHPLAHAFRKPGQLPEVSNARVEAGRGVRGQVDGVDYRIGSPGFAGPETGEASPARGGIWLADPDGWLAAFEIRDGLREGAREAVDYFARHGIHPTIASGDHRDSVCEVATRLAISDWHADLDPADKLAVLARIKAGGGRTLAIGDGVNDAPLLAAADVSIAVQGGAELANSAADLILTGRSLDLVRQAHELAVAARRTIAQNMLWAVSYNATMVPLAFTGLLRPWMAALGMSASSLLVVLNAARLGRKIPAVETLTASTAAGERP
jgi:Cu2+-exporting ATPase